MWLSAYNWPHTVGTAMSTGRKSSRTHRWESNQLPDITQEECLSGAKEASKHPQGVKNQTEQKETWVSSVTWASHLISLGLSPSVKHGA